MSRKSQPSDNAEKFGLYRMTKEAILKLCKKNSLYATPRLNDVLYLHYQGYQAIECLEEYTGLKCIWLENNAITEISGLDHQKELRCLFLHNNLIKKVENLQNCPRLDTINLSHNFIATIENLGSTILGELNTLNVSHNKLQTANDIAALSDCLTLSVLDLSHNRIDDLLIVGVLAKMPELRVLVLTGNPVVSQIPSYRKTLINECKQLTYLDSRPVFDKDRACAEAWKRGGFEEERREQARWIKAERKKVRESVNATLALRRKYAAASGGGEPAVELLVSSSDEDECNGQNDISVLSGRPTKFRKCSKCSSSECKFVDRCNGESSTSSEPQTSDNEVNLMDIFNEVAGDDSVQVPMYAFDATDDNCTELNRHIYDNLVNHSIDPVKEVNSSEMIKKSQNEFSPDASETAEKSRRNELIEFESADKSIMSQLHNISSTTSENHELEPPRTDRVQFADSAIHVKRRLIIEAISVDKFNETAETQITDIPSNLDDQPENTDTNEAISLHPLEIDLNLEDGQAIDHFTESMVVENIDCIPGSRSPMDSKIISHLDYKPEAIAEVVNVENSETLLLNPSVEVCIESTELTLPLDVSSNESDITSKANTAREEESVTSNSEPITAVSTTESTVHHSVSLTSSEDVEFFAHVFAISASPFDSPKSIAVASKYQNLRTRDQAVANNGITSYSGLSVEEIVTSEESESDENIVQSTVEPSGTIGSFLNEYNVFLETMGSRLDQSRELIERLRLTRAQRDEIGLDELSELQPATVEECFDQDADALTATELTDRSELIDRLLVAKSPLFDLSAADVNRQIEVLRDNNFNATAEMVERVYSQKDRLHTVQKDDESSLKDFCEIFGNFIDDDESEPLLGEIYNGELDAERAEPLNYFMDYEEAQRKERENGGRLTIYCENVDKLLVKNSSFTPDLKGFGDYDETDEDVPDEITEPSGNYEEFSVDRLQCLQNQPDSINEENDSIEDTPFESIGSELSSTNCSRKIEDPINIGCVAQMTPFSCCTDLHYELLEPSDHNVPDQNELSNINSNSCALVCSVKSCLLDVNATQPSTEEPTTDELCSFEYIKNLVVDGPKLSDFSDVYAEMEGTCDESADEEAVEQSEQYDRYVASMEALDRQLFANVEQALIKASLEFKVLESLSEMDDPTGDNVTDINERADRYTTEFMERYAAHKSALEHDATQMSDCNIHDEVDH